MLRLQATQKFLVTLRNITRSAYRPATTSTFNPTLGGKSTPSDRIIPDITPDQSIDTAPGQNPTVYGQQKDVEMKNKMGQEPNINEQKGEGEAVAFTSSAEANLHDRQATQKLNVGDAARGQSGEPGFMSTAEECNKPRATEAGTWSDDVNQRDSTAYYAQDQTKADSTDGRLRGTEGTTQRSYDAYKEMGGNERSPLERAANQYNQDMTGEIKQKAHDVKENIKEKAHEYWDEYKDDVRKVKTAAKDKYEEIKDETKEKSSDAMDKIKEMPHMIKEKFKDVTGIGKQH